MVTMWYHREPSGLGPIARGVSKVAWFWVVVAIVAFTGAVLGERGFKWLYDRQQRAARAGRKKLAAALSVGVVFGGVAVLLGKEAGLLGEVATHEVTKPTVIPTCQIDPQSPGCPDAPPEPDPLDNVESTP